MLSSPRLVPSLVASSPPAGARPPPHSGPSLSPPAQPPPLLQPVTSPAAPLPPSAVLSQLTPATLPAAAHPFLHADSSLPQLTPTTLPAPQLTLSCTLTAAWQHPNSRRCAHSVAAPKRPPPSAPQSLARAPLASRATRPRARRSRHPTAACHAFHCKRAARRWRPPPLAARGHATSAGPMTRSAVGFLSAGRCAALATTCNAARGTTSGRARPEPAGAEAASLLGVCQCGVRRRCLPDAPHQTMLVPQMTSRTARVALLCAHDRCSAASNITSTPSPALGWACGGPAGPAQVSLAGFGDGHRADSGDARVTRANAVHSRTCTTQILSSSYLYTALKRYAEHRILKRVVNEPRELTCCSPTGPRCAGRARRWLRLLYLKHFIAPVAVRGSVRAHDPRRARHAARHPRPARVLPVPSQACCPQCGAFRAAKEP